MQFESANPSIVRSVKQRDLINAWLRALGKGRTLPMIGEYGPDRIADELPDMMGFDVVGEGERTRFLITQEGARLAATYGNDHIDPGKRTNRYLDDAIGPTRYARVIASYSACVVRKRPTYSVSKVRDADGKDVSYERLLLPFGSTDAVEQIVGSYHAISIDGGFKITNLMGMQTRTTPVSVVNAVIDREFSRSPAHHPTAADVIELD
jgi:hypothetical protein